MTRLTRMFTDLVRVETRLFTAIDARIRASHGLTLGQVEFLQVIRDVENCRVYDIVQDVGITVGAVSKAVDRLEAAGWVRRSANPDDRRSSLLSLTPEGAARLKEAEPAVEAALADHLDGPFTSRQLDQLAASLAELRRHLEERRTGSA